jgi:phosphoribosylformylglycinamidine synthase PurS subunit
MIFKADIVVKATQDMANNTDNSVLEKLNNLSIREIKAVKVGKYFLLEIEANSKNAAAAFVEEACKRLLADESSESFEYTLGEL